MKVTFKIAPFFARFFNHFVQYVFYFSIDYSKIFPKVVKYVFDFLLKIVDICVELYSGFSNILIKLTMNYTINN